MPVLNLGELTANLCEGTLEMGAPCILVMLAFWKGIEDWLYGLLLYTRIYVMQRELCQERVFMNPRM